MKHGGAISFIFAIFSLTSSAFSASSVKEDEKQKSGSQAEP